MTSDDSRPAASSWRSTSARLSSWGCSGYKPSRYSIMRPMGHSATLVWYGEQDAGRMAPPAART